MITSENIASLDAALALTVEALPFLDAVSADDVDSTLADAEDVLTAEAEWVERCAAELTPDTLQAVLLYADQGLIDAFGAGELTEAHYAELQGGLAFLRDYFAGAE